MKVPLYELKSETEEMFDKFMELSSPGTVHETNDEFKDRKIECMKAAARVMQGRATESN